MIDQENNLSFSTFIGKQNEKNLIVDDDKLACNVRSGEIEVLATPVIVSFMEQAANELLKEVLPKNMTTVGIMISIDHKAPTVKGQAVNVIAKLISVEGRKFIFEVSASDESGEVASGKHERFMVDKSAFIDKAFRRAQKK